MKKTYNAPQMSTESTETMGILALSLGVDGSQGNSLDEGEILTHGNISWDIWSDEDSKSWEED